jgi:hypothetical protein
MVFVVTLGASAASVRSETQPDLSGRWLLVASQPAGTAALGLDVTIVQSGTTLQMSLLTVGSPDSRTSVRAPEYGARINYELDGAEHPTKVFFEQPLPQARSGDSVITMTTEESTSKATWVGGALVLMSYNRLRTTAPGREPTSGTTRQTVRRVLSVDSAGVLEAESVILADPSPWARSVHTPIPVKSTYRRQQ